MKKNNSSRTPRPRSEFDEQVIQVDRVTRVVAGGRRMRFRAAVVVGNRKGKVGLGIAKSDEVATAVKKAVNQAKKNMINVALFKDTIAHHVKSKFKSSVVILMPAYTGTGVIAGGSVRTVVELAGINNILSKSHRSNNKINTAYATLKALAALRMVEEPAKSAQGTEK
ncbi:MAG: 30S ribosomal protein S5 [Candidatus Abawacabacteria bacterium]|nr:30S ribosomal protein S5 [Candidatus Abawacabacteria bacterium]